MHMSDGVLSPTALSIGWTIAVIGVGVGLKKMDHKKVVRVSLMSAAFFLASLVNVKVGPSSTHLSLLAPIGLVLGWGCFPAMFIALLLQALLLQFGGLWTLGVNCVDVAVPTVIAYYACRKFVSPRYSNKVAALAGFLAGFLAVTWCAFSVGFFLMITSPQMQNQAVAVAVAHLPLMVIEGLITAAFVLFLRKAAPDMLAK